MTTTPHLALPLIVAAQAQKHVTHNEALASLDALVQLSVKERNRTAAPASPAEGDRYLVGTGATGVFAGHADEIALFDGGAWRFLAPRAGWLAYVAAEDLFLLNDGAAWDGLGGAIGPARVPAGTAASPALAPVGDEDTGLFFPAANALAWSTGGIERVRVDSDGRIGLQNGAIGSTVRVTNEFSSATETGFRCHATSNAYTGNIFGVNCNTAAGTGFRFASCFSDVDGAPDLEWCVRGDGATLADGAYTGTGADYAEYFEWADGNPSREDRRGLTVVPVGEKIRPATALDSPVNVIGAVSGNPSMVGDAAALKWAGKYLRDDFGAYRLAAGKRILNQAYDPTLPYAPRSERPEWACVGLLGKLRLRKGQPVGGRWIKLRDVSATIEEWLVR
jgi:hypothetical protein